MMYFVLGRLIEKALIFFSKKLSLFWPTKAYMFFNKILFFLKKEYTIDNSQQKERFSSNPKDNNEDEILELYSNNFPIVTTILLNKITSTGSINFNNNIKQLYNPCIESKYTKIVWHKKMTLTSFRL